MGGCLSVCCSSCGMTEIWVMKEYKVRSSWTMTFLIHTSNRISPICTIKDGEILGSNCAGTGRLEKRNDKGELLEHFMDTKGQRFSCANLQAAMLLPLPTSFWETSEED
ncbi:hypothetical protein glysoja_045669 [Glycine soja]|uniref:F-box/kelch-repeat protein n=1 Tax=Glycine soja TaxID=3848 RepID=A0A0B2SIW7_GLYSO|nr:hypothetical protein glysoja_045669 [Glycine soja]